MVREITNKILEAIEEGTLDAAAVLRSALAYMSERDVADMAHREELFPEPEEEEPTEEACSCTDGGCACGGICSEDATAVLFRIDMEDETGCAFCEACADDAMQSGVFRREK